MATTATIKGKITVHKWAFNAGQVSQLLAADPGIRASLVGLAEMVAEGTAKRFSRAKPPNPVVYEKYLGHYWSADPGRVAKEVKVKDIGTFPTSGGQGRVIPVALVVADHPYSVTYEKGLDEFPQVNAMAGAIQAVANRSPRLKVRKPA